MKREEMARNYIEHHFGHMDAEEAEGATQIYLAGFAAGAEWMKERAAKLLSHEARNYWGRPDVYQALMLGKEIVRALPLEDES